MPDGTKPALNVEPLSSTSDWNDVEQRLGPSWAGLLRHKQEAPIRRRIREEELEHARKLAAIQQSAKPERGFSD